MAKLTVVFIVLQMGLKRDDDEKTVVSTPFLTGVKSEIWIYTKSDILMCMRRESCGELRVLDLSRKELKEARNITICTLQRISAG